MIEQEKNFEHYQRTHIDNTFTMLNNQQHNNFYLQFLFFLFIYNFIENNDNRNSSHNQCTQIEGRLPVI